MADSAEPRSPPPGAAQGGRFSAFISYSHRDAAFARRLHRDLEGYRLPHRLAARSRSGKRLKPIFRDSDELSATYDLTVAVREAIDQAEHLIVVCSPNAVQSPWVGREIELFRALHGDSAILAVLAEGEPAQAFPQALRHALDGHAVEPLAADFRPEGGGRRLEILRLVAVLAGVRLDELVQRDAHRQVRRMALAAGGAVAGLAVVGVLTTLTFTARAETERKREQATGLVDHMLTEVRKNLQRTGRLDQLAAVNESAMAYYRGQDLANLSDDELRQRAKLLQAMGEDDEKRGDLAKARGEFVEAHRTTAKLLADRPNDTARIFAHAQSEYWVGFAAWQGGDPNGARDHFRGYTRLAQRLVALDPTNRTWLQEHAYALGNLGLLSLRHDGDAAQAEAYFQAELRDQFTLLARSTSRDSILADMAETYAWLADSQRIGRRYDAAQMTRTSQDTLLRQLLASRQGDLALRSDLAANKLALARIAAARGLNSDALEILGRGRREAHMIQVADPSNSDAAAQVRMFELFEAKVRLVQRPADARFAQSILHELEWCRQTPHSGAEAEAIEFCDTVRARAFSQAGDSATGRQLLSTISTLAAGRDDRLTERWGINLAVEIADLAKPQ